MLRLKYRRKNRSRYVGVDVAIVNLTKLVVFFDEAAKFGCGSELVHAFIVSISFDDCKIQFTLLYIHIYPCITEVALWKSHFVLLLFLNLPFSYYSSNVFSFTLWCTYFISPFFIDTFQHIATIFSLAVKQFKKNIRRPKSILIRQFTFHKYVNINLLQFKIKMTIINKHIGLNYKCSI